MNQLYKRQLGYGKIYPITYIESVKDRETGKSLSDILKEINHFYLTFTDTRAETRLKVPMSVRRKGLWISYPFNWRVVTEAYTNDVVDDASWSNDDNWKLISSISTDEGLLVLFARLIIDDLIDWTEWRYLDESFKTDENKKQNALNRLLLLLHDRFSAFMLSTTKDGRINNWKDIERFFADISDRATLKGMLATVYNSMGVLSVELNPEVPGLLVATYTSEDLSISDKSALDLETGELKIIYDFSVVYPTSY